MNISLIGVEIGPLPRDLPPMRRWLSVFVLLLVKVSVSLAGYT